MYTGPPVFWGQSFTAATDVFVAMDGNLLQAFPKEKHVGKKHGCFLPTMPAVKEAFVKDKNTFVKNMDVFYKRCVRLKSFVQKKTSAGKI